METSAAFELLDADRLALLQSLKTCMILHDAQTKAILWANAAACHALGFTVEELLPLKAPDMTRNAWKYRHEIGLQWLEDAVANGESIIEWCYRAKDGTEILSEAVATRVKLHDRDVLMVQFRDIAAEERIKKDLKRFETRLKEFMHDLSEGIAVLSESGEIKYLSESSCRLLGLPADASTPMNFTALCDGASRQVVLAQLAEAGLQHEPGSEPVAFRYRIRNGDGSLRWHDAFCRHVELEDDLSGILLHFRDVTPQVEAEEMRRASERKLEYLARYNAMGEMAMTLAHELSQPLASARNFLEGGMMRLNASPGTPDDVMWGLESVLKQVERASVIVKSVRDYVVKLEQVEEAIDLNAIVHDVEYFIALKAREAGVSCKFALGDRPLWVRCEKILIGQVILNFAFNAVEAMLEVPERSRSMTIGTCAERGRAVLRVSDTGVGIDLGRHEKVFDGFFTSKLGGNGIGLSLCKNIVSRHGGDVWAEANPERGTSFCFSLPLESGQMPEE
ncbi:PAS domain-containing sensor histidine kinase [Paraburkholderia lacunae]|uniref:histidine kinase n=1 Tax=Paraburkholderia lacunae TaxID=2211104 RepID=A0A370N7E7_9BURK|nr:ATP-binding protein [Paraburkholderia lacunae]RDK01526.1 PAS domain-containing sensor histidine kinase [Paraburkholderia lacunae]